MRRKPGQLVPLEIAICAAAHDLWRAGTDEFHGYEMATRIREVANRRLLTAYGTLYRALARLEDMGLLASRWEDPEIPARENRPGRRLYTLTPHGRTIAKEHAQARRAASGARRSRRLKTA